MDEGPTFLIYIPPALDPLGIALALVLWYVQSNDLDVSEDYSIPGCLWFYDHNGFLSVLTFVTQHGIPAMDLPGSLINSLPDQITILVRFSSTARATYQNLSFTRSSGCNLPWKRQCQHCQLQTSSSLRRSWTATGITCSCGTFKNAAQIWSKYIWSYLIGWNMCIISN